MSFANDPPQILRGVEIPIANQEYCRKQYRPYKREVTDRMICAGFKEGEKSPCYGDSGGPLVHFKNGAAKLVGVVSWGLLCAVPEYPGVFGRVTSVRSWIKSISGV